MAESLSEVGERVADKQSAHPGTRDSIANAADTIVAKNGG